MKVGFLAGIATLSLAVMGAEAPTMGLQLAVSGAGMVAFLISMFTITKIVRGKEAGWKK